MDWRAASADDGTQDDAHAKDFDDGDRQHTNVHGLCVSPGSTVVRAVMPVQRAARTPRTRVLHAYTMARRAELMVAWEDFAATAETGDLALFSGQSLISSAIKIAELGSNWSHIGMFVRTQSGQLRIWESTNADGQKDLLSGTQKGGVRLVDAETAVRAYLASADQAMVVARRLYVDRRVVPMIHPSKRIPQLERFMKAVQRLPYEQDPVELMRASELARWLELVYAWRSRSSFFCSELVACSYIQLGLLPDENESIRDASLYTPMDFAQESQNLPFLYDAETNQDLVALGPHLQLVFPNDTGPDPMKTTPKRMSQPSRPQLRVNPESLTQASPTPSACRYY